ncbi:MAG: 5'-nucleotidase C-terminal domain-containing protein, partial [Actinomyces sp.]|nr:5'-nucleotidase C-terminal domain-containing protein [Actinomyces sp.]
APTPAPAPETGGDSATDPTADAATGLSAADSGVLSILSTTDVHGHVLNWDYFRDAAPAHQKAYGLSRLATAVQDIREQRGTSSVLLLDNGDAIQGTPLTYLAAQQPEKLTGGDTHPMARAFNLMDYDVQNLGNHEFNYGLDTLATYENQLEAPLLGANVVKAGTQDPAFEPYTILDRTVAGHPVKVGVLGLVTPGIRIWDKAHVEGKLEFRDPTSTAAKYVPQMKQQGADIVVILAHTGLGVDSEWLPEQLQENTAQFLTTMVDGVDVVIGGHTHKDIPSRVTHSPDGSPVLFTQPNYWAQSLSDVQLPLTFDEGGTASVAWPSSDDIAADNATIATWATSHPAPSLTDSDLITQDPLLAADHEDTRTYVNTVVAQSSETMSAASSRYEDTPILDFIGAVMVDTVRQGIAGTPASDLPVIAQVSPFSRDAVFTKGDVTIKDVAGLYIYDNTLMGVQITGAQLRDYMEFSAKYFVGVDEGATFDPETGTNAEWNGSTIPDYNYDALTGVDYRINISKPVGQRIEGLSYNGVPVADGDRFVLAINNYRQSGGGGFPHVTEAPVVYNELVEIRQQMIEYAQAKKVIDPADFFVENWKLTTTEEVGPTPGPSEQPTPGPTPAASQGTADGGTSASHPADLAHTGANTARVLGVVALLLLIGGLGIALKHRSR